MDPKETTHNGSGSGTPEAKVLNATQASKQKQVVQAFVEAVRQEAEGQKALAKWIDDRRERSAGRESAEEQARRDRNAGIFNIVDDEEPANSQPSDEAASDGEDDDTPVLAYEDEWDKPGAVNRSTPEDEEGFAKHRVSRPIQLEVPANIHHIDDEAVADLAHVAVRENWTPEFAQGLVNTYITSAPKDEKLDDPDRTVSSLRFDFGDQTDTILREVAAFVEKRPALSSWLDATGVGNSPTAIKLLAAAAREPALLTKGGADKFIAGLKENKKYRDGDKLEIVKAKLAFTVAG